MWHIVLLKLKFNCHTFYIMIYIIVFFFLQYPTYSLKYKLFVPGITQHRIRIINIIVRLKYTYNKLFKY